MPPVEPMLAKSVPQIPEAEGMSYEPKWDGFRCIVFRDGDEVELASRGGKTLTRYFPEVVEQAKAQLPERCAVDGEIVVDPPRSTGQQPKLDVGLLDPADPPGGVPGEACSPRTPRPTSSRSTCSRSATRRWWTSRTRPAGPSWRRRWPRSSRRCTSRRSPTTSTTARRWFEIFEGAGLDGLIAKPADIAYEPNKRLMFKIKHARTADAVVAGFRWHKSGPVVGSLLLGLYDDEGTLHHIGVSSSFSMARRAELLDELRRLPGARPSTRGSTPTVTSSRSARPARPASAGPAG